jgi:hypothetical protein
VTLTINVLSLRRRIDQQAHKSRPHDTQNGKRPIHLGEDCFEIGHFSRLRVALLCYFAPSRTSDTEEVSRQIALDRIE